MSRLSALGRALFGGMLAYTAIDNLRDLDGMAAYADSKGVPMADYLVPLSSVMLLLGSVATVFGRVPRLAAGAIAAFLAGTTPMMHDFWNMDEEERDSQQIHFIKNTALFGGALFLFARDLEDN